MLVLLMLQAATSAVGLNEIAKPARPRAISWMSDMNYPAEAAKLGQEGKVRVTYEISARGRPENCTVVDSSGSPSLDAGACHLVIAGPTFYPAQDADGHAVRSVATRTINWTLPHR